MFNNLFSQNLRSYRKDLGLTLEELAKRVGISFSTLGYYERGSKCPTLYTLLLLANFFELNLHELCSESFCPFSEQVKEKLLNKK